ncbi:hypothetical protein E2C01_042977 [Portunus trituberculatus]|uniref:Uncharacterized protein n=1 Tax=Portunus trituberculatus TaxID=210409 RepID=A0A5B7FW36_PORTR|nr:hypothetical protein [Portunus trituberculatus]
MSNTTFLEEPHDEQCGASTSPWAVLGDEEGDAGMKSGFRTGSRNRVAPLRAPRTDRYHLSAVPTMETVVPSKEPQPTLEPWTGFEPVRLETSRTPKHAWFHCTTAAFKNIFNFNYYQSSECSGSAVRYRITNRSVTPRQRGRPLLQTNGKRWR